MQEIIKTSKKIDVSGMGEPDDVKKAAGKDNIVNEQKPVSAKRPRSDWDLTGSFSDCILRYGEELTAEEMEILSQCLKDGLSDRQMKKILILPDACAMENYRKIFLSANRSR